MLFILIVGIHVWSGDAVFATFVDTFFGTFLGFILFLHVWVSLVYIYPKHCFPVPVATFVFRIFSFVLTLVGSAAGTSMQHVMSRE